MSDTSPAPGSRDPGDAVPEGVAVQTPAPLSPEDEKVLRRLRGIGSPLAGGAPPHVEHSAEEGRNIDRVCEYMLIVHDPARAGAQAVAHLCAPGNRFVAPTTCPGVATLEDYAEAQGRLMRALPDLRLLRFDVLLAQGDRVCLRYTAEASHGGAPHGAIAPSGRRAEWTAGAFFQLRDGQIVECLLEWDRLALWEQLGWPVEECLSQAR